jgi:hypothetical protein
MDGVSFRLISARHEVFGHEAFADWRLGLRVLEGTGRQVRDALRCGGLHARHCSWRRAGGMRLCKGLLNEELLVSVSEEGVLNESLSFVHTARRYLR